MAGAERGGEWSRWGKAWWVQGRQPASGSGAHARGLSAGLWAGRAGSHASPTSLGTIVRAVAGKGSGGTGLLPSRRCGEHCGRGSGAGSSAAGMRPSTTACAGMHRAAGELEGPGGPLPPTRPNSFSAGPGRVPKACPKRAQARSLRALPTLHCIYPTYTGPEPHRSQLKLYM